MAMPKTPLDNLQFDQLRIELAGELALFLRLLQKMRRRSDPKSDVSIEEAVKLFSYVQRALLQNELGSELWKLEKLLGQAADLLRNGLVQK